MAKKSGVFFRYVSLLLDKDASQRMQREAQEALDRAGKLGGEALQQQLEQGGAKAGRALVTHLKREADKTLAQARVGLANGLIDQKQFKQIEAAANRSFNGTLIPLMQKLRAEGKLTEIEYGNLSRQIRKVGDEGDRAGSRWGGMMDGLKGRAVAAAGALAAFFAVDRIVAFGRASVAEATDAEAVWASLGNTLENVGVTMADVRAQLEDNAGRFERSTRFDGEAYARTLDTLIQKTGDYEASLRLMGLTANIAAKYNLSLEDAGDKVAKMATGQVRAFKEFGITTKDANEGLRELSERVNGAAAADLATMQGQTAQAAVEFGNLKEAIGETIIAGGEQASVMGQVREALRDATAYVRENREESVFWARAILASLRAVWHLLMLVPRAFINVLQATASGLYALFATVEIQWHATIHRVKSEANALIEGLNKLPGVEIGFRFDTSTFARQAAEARRQLRTARDEFVSAGEDIGDAFKSANRAIVGLADPMSSGGSAGSGGAAVDEFGLDGPLPRVIANATPGRGGNRKRKDALTEEIERLAKVAELSNLTATETARVVEIERTLTAELGRGNLTLERRAELLEKLSKLQPATEEVRFRRGPGEVEGGAVSSGQVDRSGRQVTAPQQIATRGARAARSSAAGVEADNLAAQASLLQQIHSWRALSADERESARALEAQILALLQGQELSEARKAELARDYFSVVQMTGNATALSLENVGATIRDGFVGAAGDVAGAWSETFGLLFEEGATLGAFFDSLWAGMIAGSMRAVQERATGKAAEAWMESAEAAAKGIIALAGGNFASAAAYGKGALEMAAVAAGWSALAGGAGALGNRGGGGGGGSAAPRESRDAGLDRAQRAEKLGPEVHIHLSGEFDVLNPRLQTLLYRGVQYAEERYAGSKPIIDRGGR